MRTVLVSIKNCLLSEAITRALTDSGGFNAVQASKICRNCSISESCKMLSADIALMGVSYAEGDTMESRLADIKKLRSESPECKIAIMCDENSTPELADEVVKIKKDNLIDAFFYSSVSAKYLIAALESI